MKILLDEDLNPRLRHLFEHDDVRSVRYMGWKGSAVVLTIGDQAPLAAPATFLMSVLDVARCGIQPTTFLNPSLSRKKVVSE